MSQLKIPKQLNFPAVIRIAIMLMITLLAGFALTRPQHASAAQTATAYCSQYTSAEKLNACKDGINGTNCADYQDFGQDIADVCSKAAQAKANGQITGNATYTPQPTGGTSAEVYKNVILNACAPYQNDTAAALWCLYGGLGQDGKEGKPKTVNDCLTKSELRGSSTNQAACVTGASAGQSFLSTQNGGGNDTNTGGSGGNVNPNQLLDMLDETKNLSDFLDVLHQNGPDAGTELDEIPDDTPGSYINGAGKKQPIKYTPPASGQGNAPAILFFNGGGWHANDHTSDFVATGSPSKNGDSNLGSFETPAGGGATQRGYGVFDITYRLGSSGVYYMFEDVMRGIQHVRNNADKYGIDPSKIAIWGDSAGGSLSMRASASGKSGAKAAVGWSAPTNAFTALFKSYKSMLIGMDHSTCIPTDLAGMANITDLLNGGSGDVAEYGQGLSSNDFSGLGITQGPTGMQFNKDSIGLGTLNEVLMAGQYAMQTSQNVESISSQLQNGGLQSMTGNVFNLSSKKFIECMDNFQALSPALFASPESAPSYLAGFDNDDLIDPDQAYAMRDKLRSLGIRSEAKILTGDPNAAGNALGATTNHLGYDPRFVCDTLNFLDEIIRPEIERPDCVTGLTPSQSAAAAEQAAAANSGGGSSSGSGGGSSGSNSSGSGGGSQSNSQAKSPCDAEGYQIPGGPAGPCPKGTRPAAKPVCDVWDSRCNGGTSTTENKSPQAPPKKPPVSCPPGYASNIGGTTCIRKVYATKV